MRTHLPALLACLLACAVLSPVYAQADRAQVDVATQEQTRAVPAGLTLRARVTAITPAEPTAIEWRYGGEGNGGNVTRALLENPDSQNDKTPKPLAINQWSAPVAFTAIFPKGAAPKRFFLTFKAGSAGKPKSPTDRTLQGFSRDLTLEIEFSFNGKVIKTLTEKAANGGTVGIMVPFEELAAGKTPESPEFTQNLVGLLDYAKRRAKTLESLPWAGSPLPTRIAFITDLGGYGEGSGYGIRHSDPAVIDAEALALRQLGVNGLRAAPGFLLERAKNGDPAAASLLRFAHTGPTGFPVPRYVKERPDPQAGCPYAPGVPQRTQAIINRAMSALSLPVEKVWVLTVDEIGAVQDQSAEGKSHLATCPACAKAYQDFLQARNLTPNQLGANDWASVRPLNLWNKDKSAPQPDLANPQTALNAYYTRVFLNHSTAKLFTPLRQAISEANKQKQDAIAAGNLDSPIARQPWIYSYALRGNTFLMGGHSLDFFEFYRLADNVFDYETSNRDPRVWQWDSYLCDVGRYIASEQSLGQAIYVKPHRGAPIQRALSAIARGCDNVFWYTYGPDYAKGDSFSERDSWLRDTSKAAHLIGKAEDALYGAKWANPAQIAIVKPNSSEIWLGLSKHPAWSAAFENAKWTHTALTHADLPVDALDETALATIDLARYKAIYYMGPNITRAAAAKLEAWVKNGGLLYTAGYGLSRDEANQPLDSFLPVLGVTKRMPPQMWRTVPTYAAGKLENFADPKNQLAPLPADITVAGAAPFASDTLKPVIGRETLFPAPSAKILATFADKSPAAIVHNYGKGQVYLIGFYPGLEYTAPVLDANWDMSTGYSSATRSYIAGPALTAVTPNITSNSPTVEIIHLKHPKTNVQSLVLMNWAYRASPAVTHVPVTDMKIRLRSIDVPREVTSTALNISLPIIRDNHGAHILVPKLEEGDVLIFK